MKGFFSKIRSKSRQPDSTSNDTVATSIAVPAESSALAAQPDSSSSGAAVTTVTNTTSSSTSAIQPDNRIKENFPIGVKEWVPCDDAEVDICFIHGLTGNRDATWTYKGQQKPWPELLIPAELKGLKARIITFGYDAYVIQKKHASSNSMTDHAEDLLGKLTLNREKVNALDRKLIFIAHSLGGLVAKQAILDSKDSPEPESRKLYESLIGIVFMGTPHTGSGIANWATLPASAIGIFKSANTFLLEILQTDSELLKKLNTSFLKHLRTLREAPGGKQIQVICFYEELGMTKIGKIVTKESATFASDEPLSIYANHSEMVKFGSVDDDAFQNVLGYVNRWTKHLRSYEQKQCLNPSDGDLVNLALDLLSIPRTDNTRSNMAVCIEMLKLKRELKDHSIQSKSLSLNAPENRERLSNLQKGIVDTYQHAVDQCRKSLNFKSRGLTEEKVETADEDTCQWIHKNNEFDTWLGGEQPLLWIKGHPGSGKSFLMKSLLQHKSSFGSGDQIFFSFFFTNRGSMIDKTPEALYRTLLFQMITKLPTVACHLVAKYLDTVSEHLEALWPQEVLADSFYKCLTECSSHNLFILIDALDECPENDVRKLVKRFETTVQKFKDKTPVKVCWSSRFYPNISLSNPALCVEIIMDKYNGADIERHVNRVLSVNLTAELAEIRDYIVARAGGIFLWASLVAWKVRTSFDKGIQLLELQTLLGRIPLPLTELFAFLINESESDTDDRSVRASLILFIVGAERLLTLEELYTALQLVRMVQNSTSICETLDLIAPTSNDLTQFGKRIIDISKGLVEVVRVLWDGEKLVLPEMPKTPPVLYVRFIHTSVRDFVLEGSRQILFGRPDVDVFALSQRHFVNLGQILLIRLANTLPWTATSTLSVSDAPTTMNYPTVLLARDISDAPLPVIYKYFLNHFFTHCEKALAKSADGATISVQSPSNIDSVAALINYLYLCFLITIYYSYGHIKRCWNACGSPDWTVKQLTKPISKVSTQALYGYLHMCCCKVLKNGVLEHVITSQLRTAASLEDIFDPFEVEFRKLIDFPAQLSVVQSFFDFHDLTLPASASKSRGQAPSAGGPILERWVHAVFAIAAADIRKPKVDSYYSAYGKKLGKVSLSELQSTELRLLCGVSFLLTDHDDQDHLHSEMMLDWPLFVRKARAGQIRDVLFLGYNDLISNGLLNVLPELEKDGFVTYKTSPNTHFYCALFLGDEHGSMQLKAEDFDCAIQGASDFRKAFYRMRLWQDVSGMGAWAVSPTRELAPLELDEKGRRCCGRLTDRTEDVRFQGR